MQKYDSFMSTHSTMWAHEVKPIGLTVQSVEKYCHYKLQTETTKP